MEDNEIDENISYIYQCEVCLQKYHSKSEFDLHECGDIKCEICGTVRKTKQALKLHQKLHEREELERKMNEPSTETIICDECGETIGNNMIEVHMKSHTCGLKIFNCKLCSNTYLSMSKLNDHLKSHGDTCAYECETCKKEFKTFGYLKAHMETHNEIKKFNCSYCSKSYHRKWDKIKHEYIHTGEKPMECHICGKRFRVHYCLKLHLRTHTNERPYECGICHKKFKSQAVYSHHIKLHGEARPYKCPHCPKIFKTLVAMTGHKNRHEKPFSCDVCSRRFASKYDVKIHMPIHNNQENKDLFKCIICDAVYARNHALIEHLKEHENYKDEKDFNLLESMAKAGRILSVKESSTDEFAEEIDDVFVGQEEEVIGDTL